MQDRLGRTCLHLACAYGLRVDLVKRLIDDCGAQLSVLDIEGQSPVHYAVVQDRREIVQYFLEAGKCDTSLAPLAVKSASWNVA